MPHSNSHSHVIALHASFLLLNMPAQFLQEQLLISLCCILVGHIQTAALEEQCSFTDDTIINCPSWTVKRSFMMQRQVGLVDRTKNFSYSLYILSLVIFFFSATLTGLESDDSCEVSFKDASGFENKQASNGCVRSENGVWERRYVAKF